MILGDEWITLGDDPWSAEIVNGYRNGPLGTQVREWHNGEPFDIDRSSYYKWACEEAFNHGKSLWSYQSADQFRAEVTRLYKLYESIRDKGYDEYANMRRVESLDGDRVAYSGPISLQIKADGSFDREYIIDGHHRSCVLAALGLPIRVYVHNRAPEWEELRNGLYDIWKRKYLYQPIPHPDFAAWEVGHGDPSRFDVVGTYIKAHNAGGRVLDLGCNYGYQLYKFKQMGVVKGGIGVDFHGLTAKVAKLVLNKIGFDFDQASALSFLTKTQERFSAIVATALIYHLFDTNTADEVAHIVRRMGECTDHIIFDDAETIRPGIAEYMKKHSGLSTLKQIGVDPEFNRVLWALSK